VGLLVHASGVDVAGNVGYLTLAGKGKYADPEVLRVLSDVHQYARSGDVLSQASLPCGSRSARFVGAATHSAPPLAPLPAISDEDMELYDVMTSPFDNELPPPLEWQRLARRVARSLSTTSPQSSSHEGGESGGGIRAPVDARMPYLLESILLPPVYEPETEIENILSELITIGPASRLVRNVHKVVILLLSAKFGVHPRMVQEGLSRWWPHRLIVNQTGDGQVVGGRWPLGVSVATSHLPTTQRTRGGSGGEESGTIRRVLYLTGIPNSERCTQEAAVASLLLLWGNEPRVRKPIMTALFRAQLAYQAKQNRAASAARKAAEAAAEAGAMVAPGVAAASAAAVAGLSTHSAGRHLVIAPRPLLTPPGGGEVAGTAAAVGGLQGERAPVGSSVSAARAAARAAAATGPIFHALPAAQTPTPTAKRFGAAASGGSSSKRGRRTAATPRAVAAASTFPRSAAAASDAAAPGAATPPVTVPLVTPAAAVRGVDDGPHDLLDASGLQVAHGMVDSTRKVLHGRAVPDSLIVVLLQGVFNSRCTYAHEMYFPVEPPGDTTRLLGDAVGSYIVWDRELILPA